MATTLLNSGTWPTALHPLSVGLPYEPNRVFPVRGKCAPATLTNNAQTKQAEKGRSQYAEDVNSPTQVRSPVGQNAFYTCCPPDIDLSDQTWQTRKRVHYQSLILSHDTRQTSKRMAEHPTTQRADGHHFTEHQVRGHCFAPFACWAAVWHSRQIPVRGNTPQQSEPTTHKPNMPREAETVSRGCRTFCHRYVDLSAQTSKPRSVHQTLTCRPERKTPTKNAHYQVLVLSDETRPCHKRMAEHPTPQRADGERKIS